VGKKLFKYISIMPLPLLLIFTLSSCNVKKDGSLYETSNGIQEDDSSSSTKNLGDDISAGNIDQEFMDKLEDLVISVSSPVDCTQATSIASVISLLENTKNKLNELIAKNSNNQDFPVWLSKVEQYSAELSKVLEDLKLKCDASNGGSASGSNVGGGSGSIDCDRLLLKLVVSTGGGVPDSGTVVSPVPANLTCKTVGAALDKCKTSFNISQICSLPELTACVDDFASKNQCQF